MGREVGEFEIFIEDPVFVALEMSKKQIRALLEDIFIQNNSCKRKKRTIAKGRVL